MLEDFLHASQQIRMSQCKLIFPMTLPFSMHGPPIGCHENGDSFSVISCPSPLMCIFIHHPNVICLLAYTLHYFRRLIKWETCFCMQIHVHLCACVMYVCWDFQFVQNRNHQFCLLTVKKMSTKIYPYQTRYRFL